MRRKIGLEEAFANVSVPSEGTLSRTILLGVRIITCHRSEGQVGLPAMGMNYIYMNEEHHDSSFVKEEQLYAASPGLSLSLPLLHFCKASLSTFSYPLTVALALYSAQRREPVRLRPSMLFVLPLILSM